MLTLYGFGPILGVADPSPFVTKVDAYLRMANIDYQFEGAADHLRKAPKGKLPYIEDKGKTVADSEFILEHLKQEYGDSLDEGLSDEQRAISYLTTKSLDENLYLFLLYSRWVRDDSWPIVSKAFFASMPFPLRKIVPFVARRGVTKRLKAQGVLSHSDEELQHNCGRSFAALTAILGDKEYFLANKPSSLDAAAYGFLSGFISVELNGPFNQRARSFPNLVAFCERVESTYY